MSEFNVLKFIADNPSMSIADALTKAYKLGIENAEAEKERIIKELEEKGLDDSAGGSEMLWVSDAIEIVKRGGECL